MEDDLFPFKRGFQIQNGQLFHIQCLFMNSDFNVVFYRLVLPSLGNNGVVSQLI